MNKSFTLSYEDKVTVYELQSISLNNCQSKKNIYVNVENNGKKYTICSLQKDKRENFCCKLYFTLSSKKDKYTFSLSNADKDQKITLIGYIDYENSNYETEYQKLTNEIDIDEERDKQKKLKENDNEDSCVKKNKDTLKENDDEESDKLSDNDQSQELETLLNKKTKEAPQIIKPVFLNNSIKNPENLLEDSNSNSIKEKVKSLIQQNMPIPKDDKKTNNQVSQKPNSNNNINKNNNTNNTNNKKKVLNDAKKSNSAKKNINKKK